MIKWIITTVISLAVVAVGLGFYLQPDSLALCPHNQGRPVTREGCRAAEVIVVISGGDTDARVDHAIKLYENGWAPLLIFSGAAEDKNGPSNAAAMRKKAVDRGVPASSILIEEASENTNRNAVLTAEILRYNNIKDVILVTSGYHMRRAMMEFSNATKSDQVVIRTAPTNDKHWNWWWWLTPRGWWLALSEFGGSVNVYFRGDQP